MLRFFILLINIDNIDKYASTTMFISFKYIKENLHIIYIFFLYVLIDNYFLFSKLIFKSLFVYKTVLFLLPLQYLWSQNIPLS